MSDTGEIKIRAVWVDIGFNVQGNGVPFKLTMRSDDAIDDMKELAKRKGELKVDILDIHILKIDDLLPYQLKGQRGEKAQITTFNGSRLLPRPFAATSRTLSLKKVWEPFQKR